MNPAYTNTSADNYRLLTTGTLSQARTTRFAGIESGRFGEARALLLLQIWLYDLFLKQSRSKQAISSQ